MTEIAPFQVAAKEPHPNAYEIVDVVANGTSEAETQMKADCRAAYAQALAWVVTGKSTYANNAKAVMNDWASTFKRLESQAAPRQVQLEAAWVAPIWAAAGEIIRHFDGGSAAWSAADIEEFSSMLGLYAYYSAKASTRSNNWGASAALTQIAVGIFLDDHDMYRAGLETWKSRLPLIVSSSGVPNEFQNRQDCHHAQYSLLGLSHGAEVAWHQGEDLYGYRVGSEQKSRLMLGLEYSSNLFLGNATVPISTGSMNCDGKMLPGYEHAYNHYKFRSSVSAQDIGLFETAVLEERPDGTPGFFMGWSTLTHGELSQ